MRADSPRAGAELELRSPNGTVFEVAVADDGALTVDGAPVGGSDGGASATSTYKYGTDF